MTKNNIKNHSGITGKTAGQLEMFVVQKNGVIRVTRQARKTKKSKK